MDRNEIGRMLLSDPLYAAYGKLLELGKRMAVSPAGTGSYAFLAPGSQKPVIKHVARQAISLHDREWRAALAWRPYGNNPEPRSPEFRPRGNDGQLKTDLPRP
jgi:hypothetical protein